MTTTPQILDRAHFNGARVRNQRLRLGLTLMQLAILVGKRYTQVARWETKQVLPHPPTLKKLAEALHVDPDYFFDP